MWSPCLPSSPHLWPRHPLCLGQVSTTTASVRHLVTESTKGHCLPAWTMATAPTLLPPVTVERLRAALCFCLCCVLVLVLPCCASSSQTEATSGDSSCLLPPPEARWPPGSTSPRWQAGTIRVNGNNERCLHLMRTPICSERSQKKFVAPSLYCLKQPTFESPHSSQLTIS